MYECVANTFQQATTKQMSCVASADLIDKLPFHSLVSFKSFQ